MDVRAKKQLAALACLFLVLTLVGVAVLVFVGQDHDRSSQSTTASNHPSSTPVPSPRVDTRARPPPSLSSPDASPPPSTTSTTATTGRRPYRALNWCGSNKLVALTFDDGPHPVNTPVVLGDLAAVGIKATFFVSPGVGLLHAQDQPSQTKCRLIETILEQGHSIQSHSWDHTVFTELDQAQIVAQLEQTRQWVMQCAGPYRNRVQIDQFRPPEGELDPQRARFISDLGYTPISWTVDTNDFRRLTRTTIVETVQNAVATMTTTTTTSSPSSLIVLLHDSAYVQGQSRGVIADLYTWFTSQGYTFVTTSQCYQACNSRLCRAPASRWPGVFVNN